MERHVQGDVGPRFRLTGRRIGHESQAYEMEHRVSGGFENRANQGLQGLPVACVPRVSVAFLHQEKNQGVEQMTKPPDYDCGTEFWLVFTLFMVSITLGLVSK